MIKNKKIFISVFIVLLVTFFCNCKYFFAGTENQLSQYKRTHISHLYSTFKFNSDYFRKVYYGIILWDKFIAILILALLVAKAFGSDINDNISLKFSLKDKKEDKIFVFIFLMLLLIPASRFNNSVSDPYENKKLANFPNIVYHENKVKDNLLVENKNNKSDKKEDKNIKFNNLYFKKLENFIDDRFYTRPLLIHINRDMVYNLSVKYPHYEKKVIDKKTKWLWSYQSFVSYRKQKSKIGYKKLLNEIYNGLSGFKQYCHHNNINFYVLVLPDKESVYHPPFSQINFDDDYIKFIRDIDTHGEFDIIFPLKELQKEADKGELLYYKTEHHLTDDGMYIAYNLLMQKIKADYPDIHITKKNEYNTIQNYYIRSDNRRSFSLGYSCHVSGLTIQQCEQFHNYLYTYYSHKNVSELKSEIVREPHLLMEKFHYNKGADYRVLLIGNSNIEALSNFLPYSFKDVYKLRLNGPEKIAIKDHYKILKNYKKEIEEFKPDIIIFCTGYNVFRNASDLVLP